MEKGIGSCLAFMAALRVPRNRNLFWHFCAAALLMKVFLVQFGPEAMFNIEWPLANQCHLICPPLHGPFFFTSCRLLAGFLCISPVSAYRKHLQSCDISPAVGD